MQVLKKPLSLILCLVLIFTAVLGNFTVFADEIVTAFIGGTGVRVRTGPDTSFSIIEQISNTNVTVLEEEQVGENLWYKVTYHNGAEQITGYIFYDPSYIRVYTYNPDADFETKLEAFPESYRDALRALNSKYPEWEFIPDNVTTSFWDSVAHQSVNMRKQVSFTSQPVSWRSMGQGYYTWDEEPQWIVTNGGWTGASREVIAYYMDPRNFLNEGEIYMFLQQGYNYAIQTEEGVSKIIAGTFMETAYEDSEDVEFEGSYTKVIMAAAEQSGVSPYVLASKIRQEIGATGTSPLISGATEYGKYFNFFNIGASGATEEAVIANGLARAAAEGWTTRSAAIIGGAKFLSDGYISKGQDTYYLQDFNVHNPDATWHQYAQAVHDARSKGSSLAKTYKDTQYPLTFKIPVFPSMPAWVCEKPEESSSLNNYYFKNIEVEGLSPSFTMFNYFYELFVAGDTSIYIEPVENAVYDGPEQFELTAGENTILLTVKSETGYSMGYSLSITAEQDCVITIATEAPPVPEVRKGDTNGDGQITVADLANIRLHLLQLYTLEGDYFTGADTNSDGNITVADLANIRLHLLGLFTIS